MRILLLSVVFIVLHWLITAEQAASQTVAIGHITAEIIESVSAASPAALRFDLKNGEGLTSAGLYDNDGWKYESIELGDIRITSGGEALFHVVADPAFLTTADGNGFTIEQFSTASGQTESEGSRALSLTGKARTSEDQLPGLYQGSYSLVLAYN